MATDEFGVTRLPIVNPLPDGVNGLQPVRTVNGFFMVYSAEKYQRVLLVADARRDMTMESPGLATLEMSIPQAIALIQDLRESIRLITGEVVT